jgi:hypothetical protein
MRAYADSLRAEEIVVLVSEVFSIRQLEETNEPVIWPLRKLFALWESQSLALRLEGFKCLSLNF